MLRVRLCWLYAIGVWGFVAGAESVPASDTADLPVTAPPASENSVLPEAPREGLSLRAAIELALNNNRTLQKAALDRETQRFDLRVAEDEFVPDLEISTGAFYNPVSVDHARTRTRSGSLSLAAAQRIPTGGRVAIVWDNSATEIRPGDVSHDYGSSLFLRLDQPLLRGGGLDANLANLRIARLSEQTNVLEFRRTVMNAVTDVIFRYRALLQASLQLEVTEAALQRARDQLRVNRALVDSGILPPVEIIQTEADIATQEFNVLSARSALESARFALIRLLDIDRNTRLDPTDPIVLPEFSLDLETARRLAYLNRPDHLEAEQAVAIAGYASEAARNNLLWDLSLATSYRLTGNEDAYDAALDRAFSRANEDWSVGLTLSIPIGDLSRRQGYLRARTRAVKAGIDLIETRENIEIELRDAFQSIELNRQRVHVAGVARELAARKLEIEKGRLQTGLTTNFAIVTFQNDLLRARLNEINAQVAYLDALTSLDETLGVTLDVWGVRIVELSDGGPPRTTIEPTAESSPGPGPSTAPTPPPP